LKSKSIKILLVDDYMHSRIIIARLLRKNNFSIEKGKVFDVIIMDMQMPIMDGFEVIKIIRSMSEYKSVPIISLSAFAMKGDREECLAVGATDYLPKPIVEEELIKKVKFVISLMI